jgi:hypothetical protein
VPVSGGTSPRIWGVDVDRLRSVGAEEREDFFFLMPISEARGEVGKVGLLKLEDDAWTEAKAI